MSRVATGRGFVAERLARYEARVAAEVANKAAREARRSAEADRADEMRWRAVNAKFEREDAERLAAITEAERNAVSLEAELWMKAEAENKAEREKKLEAKREGKRQVRAQAFELRAQKKAAEETAYVAARFARASEIAARQKTGLTLAELATEYGVTPVTITRALRFYMRATGEQLHSRKGKPLSKTVY